MTKKTSAIITAAGYGRRMGPGKKQFLTLGEIPLIAHTLQRFQDSSLINEIILVVPDDEIEYCKREIVICYNLTKVKKIISGGEKRQDSVFNGLQSVSKEMGIVVVHDGVRPFLTSQLLKSSIKKAIEKGAAVAAVPVKDTLKKISIQRSKLQQPNGATAPVSKKNFVKKTKCCRLVVQRTISEGINRDSLWRIQTPQVFKKEILIRAFEKAGKDNFYGSDESTLIVRMGIPVYVVEGSELNIKITTPEDIVLGESILLTIND